MCFFHTISEGYGTQCFENIFPQKMPLYVINFLRLSEPPKPYHLFFSPHFRVQHEPQCSVLKYISIAIFKIFTFFGTLIEPNFLLFLGKKMLQKKLWFCISFLTLLACSSIPITFSNLNANCSNLLDMGNL